MSTFSILRMIVWAAAIFMLVGQQEASAESAVGYEVTAIPVEGGTPIPVSIWYPTTATPSERTAGPFVQNVATGGPISWGRRPLIVMSHGTGGSKEGHYDTALSLAKDGFIVAALEHTGDNYRDSSRATDLANRPKEISRLIDFMIRNWEKKSAIDTRKIGAFGFSSGGFTILAAAGGVPDLSLIARHCAEHPTFFACQLVGRNRNHLDIKDVFNADTRIGALVVVAPALGFTFAKGLDKVTQPVQLWRADADEILPAPYYADAVRVALPRRPAFHAVPNAGHFDFLAPCSAILLSAFPLICNSQAGFDRLKFHTEFNREVVSFFRKKFKA